HRVLVVLLRVHLLGLVPREVLQQLHGVGLVGGGSGDARAAHVHVGAAGLLVGEDDVDRVRPGLLLRAVVDHGAHIIGVHDRQIALALLDGLGLGAVVALGLAGGIGQHALGPLLAVGLALVGHQARHQAHVVVVQARAGAHAALPAGRH